MLVSRCDAHPRYTRGCLDCRVRAAHYRRVRVAGLAAGTWDSGKVVGQELEQVRQHVRALVGVVGVGGRRVARVAGVSHHSVDALTVDGAVAMYRPVAEALLGVTVRACLALIDSPRIPVDPTGTMRRLQALAVDGWGADEIAGLLGVQPSSVRRHRAGTRVQILWGLREQYRLLYEKIQSLADPSGSSKWTRDFAAKSGFLGPERWADGEIDDPGALPLPPPPDTEDWALTTRLIEDALRDPRPGKAADYPRDLQREIARRASRQLGWSYSRIAELLGKNSINAVDYLLHGRRDRREGQKPLDPIVKGSGGHLPVVRVADAFEASSVS